MWRTFPALSDKAIKQKISDYGNQRESDYVNVIFCRKQEKVGENCLWKSLWKVCKTHDWQWVGQFFDRFFTTLKTAPFPRKSTNPAVDGTERKHGIMATHETAFSGKYCLHHMERYGRNRDAGEGRDLRCQYSQTENAEK